LKVDNQPIKSSARIRLPYARWWSDIQNKEA
jgi:hypothetical protein